VVAGSAASVPARAATHGGWKIEAAIVVAIAVACIALYSRTTGLGFIRYDDQLYVYENPDVKHGLSWHGVLWALGTTSIAYWHPITLISHMLDCELYGLEPGGHHFTNVLIHAANSVLLFVLLRRLTGDPWRPAITACFFALHPLRVESVAWVSERKDVLGAFFWLLTLYAYARYVDAPSRRRYILALGLFALGLMAKPMLVGVPLSMLALDIWPLERITLPGTSTSTSGRRARVVSLLLEKVPFLALAAVVSLVTLLGQTRMGAISSFEDLPLSLRIGNAILSYVDYLGKLFWPVNLAIFYPYRFHPETWKVGAAACLLAMITVATILLARRLPYLLAGWVWYIATALPVIGIIQSGGQAFADRYTYVPTIGLLIMLVWGAADLVRAAPQLRIPVSGLAAVLLVLLSVRSFVQIRYWRDTVTLFAHAVAVTSNNSRAETNLATALVDSGRPDEAIVHFRRPSDAAR
jgi:hypothetical protein